MNTGRTILSGLGWMITILLQLVVGQIAGTIALAIGQGAMPISIIFVGMGIALGVFLIGALAILLRRAIRPKKYLARLGFTVLGVSIPLAILVTVGMGQGFDSEIISGGLGLILTVFAGILGMIGFYVPGWIRKKTFP